jgi:ABC-type branched-subunit amino acid transport system ATPase component
VAILTVTGITKRFGGIKALDGVDLAVESGELVGLIGPNGSGKTTLFNCITGELVPDAGGIRFGETVISGWAPHRIARLGLVRTYQQIEVFPQLLVRENLLIAGQEHQGFGVPASLLRTAGVRAAEDALAGRAAEMLEMCGLRHQAEEYAGSLSYGQRKLLAIGMGLMARPQVLLLDEPTAAVNPTAIEHIVEVLRALHRSGQTIVLVEHNLPIVMGLCQRVVVLNSGRKLTEGSPDQVRRDPRVIEAYFGA